MFACSRRVCGVVAAAWLAALASARACRGVRADGALPRRPRPTVGGARAAWGTGLRSSWAGGVARAGQAAQRSESTLGSPDIGAAERRWVDQRGRGSGATLPGAPNVRSRVPAKPSRFEHWGARGDFLPTDLRPSSLRSRGRTRRTHNTKTQDLYWFGPPLWCNTLLQCGGGGLPLGLMMNSTRGRTAS